MLAIKRIHMDYETDPVGVEGMPQFGWEIVCDRRNMIQQAYHMQIAEDKEFTSLVYDSGMVRSRESAQVMVKDVELTSMTAYYVRVRVFDDEEESAWSAPAVFVTALLRKEEWKASFVSAEKDDSYREESRGTYVRGGFRVRGKIRAAYACTTALGLYYFYLNGRKVGKDEMTPGWTSYKKHLCYQTYDVTEYVKEGYNAAGAMLGAGWYRGAMGLTKARNNYGDRTAFAMQLMIRYEDGRQETICTDDSWKGSDAPIVSADIYDGEIYDAALEIPGWVEEEEPGGSWHEVVPVQVDTSILYAQAGAKVQVIDELEAVRVFQTPKGEMVVDFGQNMAGRIRITVSGKRKDVVELRCFEMLDVEGNVYLDNLRGAGASLKYVFGSDGTVTYHPHFTYMGFRYAVILSWPGIPRKENFMAQTLHSHMAQTGRINCSEPLLNQLHHNYLWSLKSNFLDVPTDCPQRDERLGWTGDAQIFCRTACYLMNAYTFYKKWLVDVAADQTPEGGVPHVVPNIEEGRTADNWLLSQGEHSAAAWADVAVINPWTLYLMYGDREILNRQYSSMKGWIDFMRAHSEDHIWHYKLQFGDWVALDAEEGSYFGATPDSLVCTAYYAYSSGLFAKTAKILEKKEAEEYRQLHEEIVSRFQETFFDQEGRMTVQTQTAHILALYFGLTKKAYVSRTLEGLKNLLERENGHLVTGFIGTPYFCHALSRYGAVKEAYELLLQEDFPSWLYQVKMGATTIWEHWDGIKPDGSMWSADMNSFNHYAYGAIGEWMYRVMAGLEADEEYPGFKRAVIYPRIGGGLAWVESEYDSVYGKVGVRWEAEEGKVTMVVDIPPNTSALVRLDKAEQILEADGLSFYSQEDYIETEAGSGSYKICFLRKQDGLMGS